MTAITACYSGGDDGDDEDAYDDCDGIGSVTLWLGSMRGATWVWPNHWHNRPPGTH